MTYEHEVIDYEDCHEGFFQHYLFPSQGWAEEWIAKRGNPHDKVNRPRYQYIYRKWDQPFYDECRWTRISMNNI